MPASMPQSVLEAWDGLMYFLRDAFARGGIDAHMYPARAQQGQHVLDMLRMKLAIMRGGDSQYIVTQYSNSCEPNDSLGTMLRRSIDYNRAQVPYRYSFRSQYPNTQSNYSPSYSRVYFRGLADGRGRSYSRGRPGVRYRGGQDFSTGGPGATR